MTQHAQAHHPIWIPPSARRVAGLRISAHAWAQMGRRKVSPDMVALVLHEGRRVHQRGSLQVLVGQRELRAKGKRLPQLAQVEGLVLVCDADGTTVVTLYKRRDLACLKQREGRHWVGR